MALNPTYKPVPHPEGRRIASFAEFYPFYLGEHAARANRVLHLAGTSLVLLSWLRVALSLAPALPARVLAAAGSARVPALLRALALAPRQRARVLAAGVAAAYACAWVGHFVCEGNRPATFRYPWWSLRSDFKVFGEIVTGKRRI